MARRNIQLRKVCPRCGSGALAEGKLPGFPGPHPTVYDLDDLPRLAARHSLDTLLALVELLPYKQFRCPSCGHSFRLENVTAKKMALGMLAALRPVSEDCAHPKQHLRPCLALRTPVRPKTQPQATSSPAMASSQDDWEPEGLD